METREIDVTTPDGTMSAYEIIPDGEGQRPAIVFLMDGLGYRAALGERYQIEHDQARHGWAVIDTPVRDAAEAERHWKAILAPPTGRAARAEDSPLRIVKTLEISASLEIA